MRLVIAMRPEWTVTRMPIGLRVQVDAGLRFLIEPAQPLPLDVKVWGDRIVFGPLPPEQVVVNSVEDRKTEEGWSFAYVISDQLGIDGALVERRIHAMVRLAQHGVVVTARSKDPTAIDAFHPVFLGRILTSRSDFTDEVTSLVQVWDGLEVNDLAPPRVVVLNRTSE